MASALPTIPRYVFCIIEPVALILAFTTTSFSSAYYVSGQSKLTSPLSLTPSETILTYQMSNLSFDRYHRALRISLDQRHQGGPRIVNSTMVG